MAAEPLGVLAWRIGLSSLQSLPAVLSSAWATHHHPGDPQTPPEKSTMTGVGGFTGRELVGFLFPQSQRNSVTFV